MQFHTDASLSLGTRESRSNHRLKWDNYFLPLPLHGFTRADVPDSDLTHIRGPWLHFIDGYVIDVVDVADPDVIVMSGARL